LFGRGKGDFLRFVEMADLAMEEAEEAAGEKECFGGMLVAYTYHHIRTCPLVDCPTKQDFVRYFNYLSPKSTFQSSFYRPIA
jgi:hypothetical protein